ncbi:MAG: PAS domain-containing protein, partial [Thermodesulfobacteriota bacterium]|nr:PAS domain-containing protein [Thermodesulfobacteriota bacterium]
MFLESGKDEHKELLAKVKEFTRKHELFFQAIPSYISVQDRDFRIIITNSLFQKDFGEQVGEKCYKVYKNRKEKCKDCPVEKTFRKGKTYSSEEIIVTDEGKEVNVIVYTSPIFGDDGTVTAVVEMMVNIDRIKKRQEKIENSMREYRNLFSSVPCYISIQDRNFRILKANKLLEDNFGDCINKFCYKVYKNREKKCENCPVEKTFKDGNVYNSEEVVLKRDDEPANVIVYTSPVRNREGKITSVMEMSTDITEVKRLQKELATLGMAMAGVTHSIKCILQGLDGAVYLIDSGLKKNNKERVTTGWKTIKNNIPK